MAILSITGAITLNNDQTLGPVALSDAITHVSVIADHGLSQGQNNWDNPLTRLIAVFEVSYDGGVTYREQSSLVADGGTSLDKNGQVATQSRCGFDIAPGAGRLARVLTSITNGPCRTAISLDLT